jgi:hypothetical protein
VNYATNSSGQGARGWILLRKREFNYSTLGYKNGTNTSNGTQVELKLLD